jgi:hypothetical protein
MPEHATVTRPRTAPVRPRRISGPVRRPLAAGPSVPRGRTGAFERLSRIPDHYVVDRLLRSRLCIWVIGILLGGIVAMQVSLLRLNSGISRAVQTQSTLELQNASLQASIAEATSGERLREAAVDLSLVEPQAGQTRYLTAHPATDPPRAARRMKPPSERAIGIMANGGKDPDLAVVTAPGVTGTADPGVTGTADPGVTQTADPGATDPATTAAVTPVPTPVVTPVPTAPPVTTDPNTGAVTAPAGG